MFHLRNVFFIDFKMNLFIIYEGDMMTYLQIIKSALKFAINEEINEEILKICYDNDIEETKKIVKYNAKLGLSYIILYVLNVKGLLTKGALITLKNLENELAYMVMIHMSSLLTATEETEKNMNSNETIEAINEVLKMGDLDESEEKLIREILYSETLNNINTKMRDLEPEPVVITSALENTLDLVIISLTDLFFTSKGRKYLPKEYWIEDDNLRNKCFIYMKNIITEYYYPNLSDEVSIPGLLVSVLKLIDIIFFLISKGEIEKIDKLIAIDNEIINKFSATSIYGYWSGAYAVINLLYNYEKIKDIDFENSWLQDWDKDSLLNMVLLDDSSFFGVFDVEQIAIILLCYFTTPNKKQALSNINRDLEEVKEILQSNLRPDIKRKRILRLILDNTD